MGLKNKDQRSKIGKCETKEEQLLLLFAVAEKWWQLLHICLYASFKKEKKERALVAAID